MGHRHTADRPIWSLVYVHVHAALPALAVFLTLAPGIVGSIVAAVFALHAAMVFPALVYINLYPSTSKLTTWEAYRALVHELFAPWRAQLTAALSLFLGIGGLGAALYLLARKAVPDVSDETRAEGLRRSAIGTFGLVFMACWFSFVNPVIEELFWRVYLLRELRGVYDAGAADAEEESGLMPSGPYGDEPYSAVLTKRGARLSRLVCSMAFASYHVVVVCAFVPWYYGVLAFCGLVPVGWLLLVCIANPDGVTCLGWKSPPLGMVAAIGAHAGLDVCFVLVMGEMYYNWLPSNH